MKPRPITRLAFPLASAIASLLAAPSASATNLWWDTNGTTTTAAAATGTWTAGSTANWTTVLAGNLVTAAVTTTNADDLTFNATGMTTATITVSGTQLAHSITFNTATTLSSGTAINLGNAAAGSGLFFGNQANTISTPIILNSAATAIAITNAGNQTQNIGAITGDAASGTQTITIGGPGSQGGPTNFNGIISNGGGGGTVAVTVNAQSTTTLVAANTYTGATSIIAGTLQINHANTFTNTSAINLGSTGRLVVNAANSSLAELATAGGGSGVVAGSFLRYSQAQTAAGAGNGPGTIFGTVELNVTGVNPNYTLDFGSGGALTNLVTSTYTSALTLSGTASIDSSTAVATYATGGITASTAGAKTLNITGTNTGANTISGNIGNGSGTLGLTKGGGGTWILSGTNTNTGTTRVDAGTLQFVNRASLYNSTTGSWTAANIRVGNGGTLALNVGGTNQFTTGDVTTLLGNLGGANGTSTTGFAAESAIGFDTTNASGGTFTVADVLANSTGTGGGAIGLTKLGTGTLVLSSDNTYTGRTVISSGGTLQLGAGGTTGKLSTSSSILNNGTLTINRSDAVVQGTDFSAAPINGTGAFIQNGTSISAITTLSAANTFSGTTTVSGGVLNLTNALALQNSALVTTGAGTVTINGSPTITSLTLGGLSGASGNLASVISSGFAGTVTNLTLNTVGAGSFTYGGAIANGAMTLTKNGTGTQILSGANTYTGATIVNAGTLTVGSGANGSLDSSSTLQMGGGIFNYSRTGAGQTVAGLTVNGGGNSTVNNTSSGQTLTLGAITRTGSVYGTVNFATLTGPISTTFTNVNSIIGPWATTGSTTTLRYAVGSAAGAPTNISALTGTTATAADLSNLVAGGNFEYSAATTTVGNLSANTLRYSGGNTTTTIGATNTLTLNGLMNAGSASTLLISGGPSTGGIIIGATNELVVTANAQNTTISSVIANGGSAGRLIYSGGGTLTLSGLNTYSGGLVINSGIVSTSAVASGSAGGTGTGPITINGAGRLTLGSGVGTLNRALTLNGGSLFFAGSGSDLTVAGTIALGANSTIDATNNNSGFPAISADISGTGGFTKTNLGGLRLNGTNTYTGPTVVSAGGVTVKSSLYGNDTAKWTPANITVAGGATLVLNVQGAGEFTIAQAATMFGQLSANVNNNGLLAGSFIGVDTRNAAAGTYTYSAIITDSTGPGGGSVSFKHTGTASTILELTGTNTYSGMSIVDNDSFLKVSSINSVFTNAALGTVHSASSSLGAPTTVANGTIHLGTAGSTAQSAIGNTFRGGGLIYTGTGETTDRVISLNGGGGETYVLDQSGTGHLKFLSSFASIDTRSVKTITLQGSTTGTGEIAGTIPNAGNGNNQLTKSGTGTWILSGTNLYAGTTTVSAGTLRAGAAASGQAFGSLSAVTTANTAGAILDLNGFNQTIGSLAGGGVTGGNVTLGANATLTTGGNNTSTSYAGVISGTGTSGLTKTGTGTQTITAIQTYTGATTITAGTLQLDGSTHSSSTVGIGTAGTLTGTGTVNGNATLTGSGIINKASGTIAGTLGVTGGNWNGAGVVTGLVTSSSGTFTIGSSANLTANGNLDVTGGTIIAGNSSSTITGSVNYTSSSNSTFAGVITGSGKTLTLNNASATLTLSGTSGYTGATTITAGTLQLDGSTHSSSTVGIGTAGTLTGTGTVNGNATLTGSGIINKASGTIAGTLGVTGGNWNGNGVVTGAVTSSSGTFTIGSSGNLTASAGVAVTGGSIAASSGTSKITGSVNYTSSSNSSFAGEIAGSGNTLTMNNSASTLTLSGTSSYTGATNVTAGTLIVNANISTSSLTSVSSGATLAGSGTVGATTVLGTLAIGNSPGTMNLTSLTMDAASIYLYEMTGGLAPGAGSADLGDISGALTIDTTSILDLVELGTYTAGNKFTLFAYDGLLTGNFSGLLNNATFLDDLSNSWKIIYDDNTPGLNGGVSASNTYVTITAVPEPRAALLGGLGLLMLLRRRRRD